jgi:hypothetical protein
VADPRRPLISGNWKMNLNHFEALQTVQKLGYLVPKEVTKDVDVSVHPPFTDLRTVQTGIDSDRLPFILGAQDCYWRTRARSRARSRPAFPRQARRALRHLLATASGASCSARPTRSSPRKAHGHPQPRDEPRSSASAEIGSRA